MKNLFLFGLAMLLIITLAACFNTKSKTLTDQLDSKAIYKISIPKNYNPSNLSDCIKLNDLDAKSGFIHTSHGNQVSKILEKFFKNNTKVLLLELDKSELQKNGIEIKVESNRPDGDCFPHLYGNQKTPASAIKSKIIVEQKKGVWAIKK